MKKKVGICDSCVVARFDKHLLEKQKKRQLAELKGR